MNYDSCKKCKFYKRRFIDKLLFMGHIWAVCKHPSAFMGYKFNDGYNFCSVERLYGCGSKATNFESK